MNGHNINILCCWIIKESFVCRNGAIKKHGNLTVRNMLPDGGHLVFQLDWSSECTTMSKLTSRSVTGHSNTDGPTLQSKAQCITYSKWHLLCVPEMQRYMTKHQYLMTCKWEWVVFLGQNHLNNWLMLRRILSRMFHVILRCRQKQASP